jgi:hypothetical protein
VNGKRRVQQFPVLRKQIQQWYEIAKKRGCNYMLVVHDFCVYGDHPVLVPKESRAIDVLDFVRAQLNNREVVIEIYDLRINMMSQLNERRALHYY